MEQRTCAECAYFLQHYTFNRKAIFRVYCGHCTQGRPHTKRPCSRSCDHFLERDPQEQPFVSREYLSKALLEYMFSLELLPQIPDLAAEENLPLPKGGSKKL